MAPSDLTVEDETRVRVARSLRELLAGRGITPTALATTLGWSKPAMSRRINGHLALNVDELQEIAYAIDMPLATLTLRLFESES